MGQWFGISSTVYQNVFVIERWLCSQGAVVVYDQRQEIGGGWRARGMLLHHSGSIGKCKHHEECNNKQGAMLVAE